MATIATVAAQAPRIVSVTPADGATDVSVSTPIVIVFDQDMDTLLAPFGALGNLAMSPANLSQTTLGTWAVDKRTLTLQPSFGPWPLTTITWTLNPAGVNPFLAVKSASGTALATVSGSFSTGQGAPVLGSVSPADNSQAVPTNTPVTFRFSQPMKKIELPGGTPPAVFFAGDGVDRSKFRYQWAVDGRSLTCEYSGGFPRNARIEWALNPAGAPVILESESGKPLASSTYRGAFTTGSGGGPCDPVPLAGWGSYGITRRGNYAQESAADPVPSDEGLPFIFGAVVASPPLGPQLTAATLEFPDGSLTNLATFNFFSFYETFPTEAELLAAYPAGTYTERFTQIGEPERVAEIESDLEFPPIPKVTNFAEAQAVAATQPFTLQWNGFTGATGDDFMTIFVSDDQNSTIVFQAPDPCVPRTIQATDTSIILPANTLSPGRTYHAEILFGKSFLFETNRFPTMFGYGFNYRSTWFPMKAAGGVTPADPAVLSGVELQDNDRVAFVLQGSPNRSYAIQRASHLDAVTWSEAGTVATDANGTGRFEDSQLAGTGPLYYRALAP